MNTMTKSYSELIKLPSFEERYNYLKLNGSVGEETFGYERHANQIFYKSPRWRKIRRDVILRDNGCDLGVEGRDIYDNIIVHHINPITLEAVMIDDDSLYDYDNLISVSHKTHNAIHYGDITNTIQIPKERKPGDTCPWR